MQTDRRSFFQRVLTALGIVAVAPVAPKVVYAEPSFSQYTKENHAIVEEFSTPRSTEAWWYRIAPPIRYKDKGSSQYVLNKTYIIRDRELHDHLKQGWYIVGQPIRGRVER